MLTSRWLQLRFWRLSVGIVVILSCCLIGMLPAIAAPIKPSVTEIQVSLGSSADELKFFPQNLEFVAGQKYKLLLGNPSPEKHYFTAKDFADASWTQKVEAGKVEVKGAVHEVELKSGGEAEWVIVPLKPGTYELHCSIPGHTEAGMTGEIVISSQ